MTTATVLRDRYCPECRCAFTAEELREHLAGAYCAYLIRMRATPPPMREKETP